MQSPADPAPHGIRREATRLSELSPQQWRAGIAAWLGWFFDGLELHLYTLVALPFVTELTHAASQTDVVVKEKSAWIQAAFLLGWALGGGLFGRLGDRLGRSRALMFTVLTYAMFTGLSTLAQTWWHLLIFRFIAALGIGGEWAVGASLLSETWPKRWRAWIAAVLQMGVNLGILVACLVTFFMAGTPPRYVFLVGIVPALLVFWIRRNVPEPDEWRLAKSRSQHDPGIAGLFSGNVLRTTLLTLAVCASSLTAWWVFMFWHPQHLRNLLREAGWAALPTQQFVSTAFFLVIGVSIAGNFVAAWFARRLGYRRAVAVMCCGLFLAAFGAFVVPRSPRELLVWISSVGFFSGVFGLFTMYLPPLFPTLLRTTGAGFCYNIGRAAAAFMTLFFGLFSPVGDFRRALCYASFLMVPAIFVSLFMPDMRDEQGKETHTPCQP